MGVGRQSAPSFILLTDWSFRGIPSEGKTPLLKKCESSSAGQRSRSEAQRCPKPHGYPETTLTSALSTPSLVSFLPLQGPLHRLLGSRTEPGTFGILSASASKLTSWLGSRAVPGCAGCHVHLQQVSCWAQGSRVHSSLPCGGAGVNHGLGPLQRWSCLHLPECQPAQPDHLLPERLGAPGNIR